MHADQRLLNYRHILSLTYEGARFVCSCFQVVTHSLRFAAFCRPTSPFKAEYSTLCQTDPEVMAGLKEPLIVKAMQASIFLTVTYIKLHFRQTLSSKFPPSGSIRLRVRVFESPRGCELLRAQKRVSMFLPHPNCALERFFQGLS